MPRTANEPSASLAPIDERADSRSKIPREKFGEEKKRAPEKKVKFPA